MLLFWSWAALFSFTGFAVCLAVCRGALALAFATVELAGSSMPEVPDVPDVITIGISAWAEVDSFPLETCFSGTLNIFSFPFI